MAVVGSATAAAMSSEEQENYNSAHMVITPRQNSLTTNSVNMLSLQKTKDIESRKNRIMADRDQV